MSNIIIIDYGAGNVQSVKFALQRIGLNAILTNDRQTILQADKIIFPGVGTAKQAMNALKKKQLDTLIPQLTQPFLGICLGLQLMCEESEENDTRCLGIFPEKVKKFDNTMKVPQIGWNTIEKLKTPLFEHITEKEYCYFVHSYYVPVFENTIAETVYSEPFSAAIHKNNFYACQFHPEKSSKLGEQIIKNFLAL